MRQGEWFTVDEVAERLKVNPVTVRGWIRSGELKAVQLGRAGYRIIEADLQAFLDQRKPAA